MHLGHIVLIFSSTQGWKGDVEDAPLLLTLLQRRHDHPQEPGTWWFRGVHETSVRMN